MKPRRQRLDIVLVERGLAPSRQNAQALIMAGRVRVEGRRADKPSSKIDAEAPIAVDQPEWAYVSRGGVKLAGALDQFAIDATGSRAVDIGASTGGFTDCLLQRGAQRVLALDVGRGQLDWKLRNDPRVTVREEINARHLLPADLPELPDGADLIVIDVSFISLKLILPRVPPLLRPGAGQVVALVKPQFEVGRGQVGRGGIVREPERRSEALRGVALFATTVGLGVRAMARSPITGAEGNVEYFLHLVPGAGGLTPAQIEAEAHRLAHEEPAHA